MGTRFSTTRLIPRILDTILKTFSCFFYDNFFFHSRKKYDSVKFIQKHVTTFVFKILKHPNFLKIFESKKQSVLFCQTTSTKMVKNSCARIGINNSQSRSVLLYKTFCLSTRTLRRSLRVHSLSKKSCIGAQIAPTRS